MVEGIVAFIDFIGSHWIDCAHGRDVKSCDDSDRTSNELDATEATVSEVSLMDGDIGEPIM